MKVSVLTLGCKVNKYESDVLLKAFKERGYEVSDKLEKADAYIINTCAVTNEAERKSRQMISRCKKFNPEAKIYVCGCASQHNPEQFWEKVNLSKVWLAKKNCLTFLAEACRLTHCQKAINRILTHCSQGLGHI